MKYLKEGFLKYRSGFVWGLTALFLVDLLELLPPLIIKNVIDSFNANNIQSTLLQFSFIYFFVAVLQSLGRYLWRVLLIRSSLKVGKDLRHIFLKILLRLPPSFYDKSKVGDLMSLATSDTETIRMALGPGLLTIADACFYFFTIPIALFILSPSLATMVLIPLLIMPFIVFYFQSRIEGHFVKLQESQANLTAFCQESVAGVRVIKIFGQKEARLKAFQSLGDSLVRNGLKLSRYQSSFGPSLDFVMSLSIVLLIFLVAPGFSNASITVGTFLAFQRYLQKLIWPMMAVGIAVTHFKKARGSEGRIVKLEKILLAHLNQYPLSDSLATFLEHPHYPDYPNNKEVLKSIETIELKNLSFSYEPNQFVLKNLNFKILKGDKIGIIGNIGSGKTTLVSLLAGLYYADSNQLLINGRDIQSYPIKELRDLISYVGQDVFLFNDTIFENAAFGSNKIYTNTNALEIEKALQAVELHEEVLKIEKAYEASVGEKGSSLSGGQKQRLSLARALVKAMEGKTSLLILDDAFSAVDHQTEEKILGKLNIFNKDLTVITIAHRVSTLKYCSRIFYMVDGSLVEATEIDFLTTKKDKLYEMVEGKPKGHHGTLV